MRAPRQNKILGQAVRLLRFCGLPAFLFCLFITGAALAQMFGASTGFGNAPSSAPKTETSAERAAAPAASSRTSASSPTAAPAAQTRRTSAPAARSSMIDGGLPAATSSSAAQQPSADQPKEDQVKTPAIVQFRFVNGGIEVNTEPKIMLYMRDFEVARNLNGRPSCSMRFYILSSAPEKITNISYRLKWPKIETVLSFDNVAPNTPTYFDYALLGDGCYSMDTPPNIIVNRCRIKGMTQRQCADAIQWME